MDDTRRQIGHREPAGLAEPNRTVAVLHELVAARLVVVDDDVVAVAREAVIRAWPRLHRCGLSDDRAACSWLPSLPVAHVDKITCTLIGR